jgi:hypothetical protein
MVERPAEGAQACEADFEADVGHAMVGCAQEEHRPFDAAALQVAMGRFAERRPEGATEVRLGNLRNPREARDVERLPKVAVHCVPRAEHPAIALFHDSSHPIRTSLRSCKWSALQATDMSDETPTGGRIVVAVGEIGVMLARCLFALKRSPDKSIGTTRAPTLDIERHPRNRRNAVSLTRRAGPDRSPSAPAASITPRRSSRSRVSKSIARSRLTRDVSTRTPPQQR